MKSYCVDQEILAPKIGVILRSGVDEVAVTADMKRMFHQVYMAPGDCGALCYLWWSNGDISRELLLLGSL